MKMLSLLLFFISFAMFSQNLTKHQWNDRLLIITSETFDNDRAQRQLRMLKKEMSGLKDRKLIIYHVTSEGYKTNFNTEVSGESEISVGEDFQITLIGLDGGEKFQSDRPEPASVFFSKIDSMPMRKAEMRQKN